MSGFTAGEVQAITEAAALGPVVGLDRLTEVFGTGTVRLVLAAAAADRLRAGETVDVGGGELLARDHGPVGRVLGRVERT